MDTARTHSRASSKAVPLTQLLSKSNGVRLQSVHSVGYNIYCSSGNFFYILFNIHYCTHNITLIMYLTRIIIPTKMCTYDLASWALAQYWGGGWATRWPAWRLRNEKWFYYFKAPRGAPVTSRGFFILFTEPYGRIS